MSGVAGDKVVGFGYRANRSSRPVNTGEVARLFRLTVDSVCRRGTAQDVCHCHELPVWIDVKQNPPRTNAPAPSCRLGALQSHEVASKRILLHRLERREQALLIRRGRACDRFICGGGEDESPGHVSGR